MRIKKLIIPRAKNAHKGNFGRVLIIAGSKGMAGAAILCARGAFRSGSGLVKVAVDESLFPVIHCAVSEATCIDRSELFTDSIGSINAFDAIAAGSGLGDTEETRTIVELLLREYKGTLVLDADALNVIATEARMIKQAAGSVIITPHVGEASRLLGISSAEINEDREGAVRALAEITDSVAVLKGHESLVAFYRSKSSTALEIYKNTTGNPGMATGGSGDVLTGIIASFAGQGMVAADAAMAGVYIHGLAGDLAADEWGEYGLTASDIAEKTAIAIKNSI